MGVCQGGLGEGEGRPLSGRGGPQRWAQGLSSHHLGVSGIRWSAVLRDLKRRGLRAPRLVVGDGHLGIWGGLAEVYPEAEEQRCWNHRILNVLDKLPKKRQAEAKALLCPIPYAAYPPRSGEGGVPTLVSSPKLQQRRRRAS